MRTSLSRPQLWQMHYLIVLAKMYRYVLVTSTRVCDGSKQQSLIIIIIIIIIIVFFFSFIIRCCAAVVAFVLLRLCNTIC